jgi:TolB-like protein
VKYRFAACTLDTDRHVFERDGQVLHIEPQVFDLLHLLVCSAGDLVTHDTLVAEVWQGLIVSDATISARINAARKAVGDSGKAQTIIETVARRGFRLIAPVVVEATDLGPKTKITGPLTWSDGMPALAVLPFNYLADSPDDVLADGVVDEITSALSRVHEFHVIARQSAFALRIQRPDARTAAQTLGADYLVEGTIRRAGDRLRVAVSLLNAQGHTLWSDRFDDTLEDLFDLQDRIATQVAGQLPGKVRAAEIACVDRDCTITNEARAWVLRALPHFWAHRREENAKAVEYLSRALMADGQDVRALAYKAWAIVQQSSYMWSEDAEADRVEAFRLANLAAERVADDAPALVAISAAYSMAVADGARALTFVRRALELDPNNAWGRLRLGWALLYDGRPEEALVEFERARRLSPLDPFLFNMRIGTAGAQADLGNYDLAIRLIHEALMNTPGIAWAYRLLVSLYGRIGDVENATAAARKLLEAHPGLTMERLAASVPPAVAERNPGYLEGLRAAGIR